MTRNPVFKHRDFIGKAQELKFLGSHQDTALLTHGAGLRTRKGGKNNVRLERNMYLDRKYIDQNTLLDWIFFKSKFFILIYGINFISKYHF